MTLLIMPRDFETDAGKKRIISKIHRLEERVHTLNQLMHECLQRESRLERDLEGLD